MPPPTSSSNAPPNSSKTRRRPRSRSADPPAPRSRSRSASASASASRPASGSRPGSASASASASAGGASLRRFSSSPSVLTRHTVADEVLYAERALTESLSTLVFRRPISHIYNPLDYARAPHEWFVSQYARRGILVLLVSISPAPWAMAQTGIPFGDVFACREYLKIPRDQRVQRPSREHPRRPVRGFASTRHDASGRRFWMDWAAGGYPRVDDFFDTFYVYDYCPFMFVKGNGRICTPAQLPTAERHAVEHYCDDGLRDVVLALRPRVACGIGRYADGRCRSALQLVDHSLHFANMPSPNPSSPILNRHWLLNARAHIRHALAQANNPED